MTEHIDVTAAKTIILIILAGYLVFRRLLQGNLPRSAASGLKYRIITSVFLSLLAAASILSYFNFGRFHGNGQQVHYWEMFHNYLNPRYFHELGYFNLYKAAVAADAEMENRIQNGTRVMDLATYQQRTRIEVLAEARAVKSKFSPERWEQFKRDLRFIMNHDNRINSMVDDHGFNATPFWTVVGRLLSSAVPLDDAWILVWLDVLLMAVMFCFVFWAFGSETALLSIVFFFSNFFTSFYFVGGSLLRFDWLAAAVIGVCCLKKRKYAAGGSLLGMSALLRVFPVLFAGALGVKMILETIREKRLPTRYLKFFGAFLLTAIVLFVTLFSFGNPIDTLSSYAGRILLHGNYLLTNNVGLKMLVLADGTYLKQDNFYAAYHRSDPTKDVFFNWNATKMQEARRLLPVFLLIALAAVALVGLISLRREDAEAAAFGTFLIFALLAPTMYYFAFLVVLFVTLANRDPNLKNVVETVTLVVAVAACHVIHVYVGFYVTKFLLVTCVMAVCFLVIGGIESHEATRRRKVLLPRSPGIAWGRK